MKQPRQNQKTRRKRPRLSRSAHSKLQDELTEVTRHRAAISEVLRAIANSPHDLQPILDTIIDSARRLCQAEAGTLRLSEQAGLRLVALKGNMPWSPPELLEHNSYIGQLAASLSPVHIPDQAAHELYRRGDPYLLTSVKGGVRTALFVPMVKDEQVIGVLIVGRMYVQPFTDKQIELVTDFAAQATIALESTRRERQYREAQTALAHANRIATIGQITASIAHELNQPLAALALQGGTALRWLAREPPAPGIDEARSSVEHMIKDADRATHIIGGLRDLTKKNAPRAEVVDLNEAIAEVIALTSSEAVESGVLVSTRLAPELPRVHGDRVQLQQVMLNLIINAIQAMSSIGEGARKLQISINAAPSEGGVCIEVRDTGPGLRPESLPRIFEPFYTTKPDGMGMGLSICRSIIEAHGGRLWATSCERGALFRFTIPAT
jgi:C4-dicarboxylate-specific signal transduction histidine kinase